MHIMHNMPIMLIIHIMHIKIVDIIKVCSGHGVCKCGECTCEENFSGKWCEESLTSDHLDKCDLLKPCVQCQVFNSSKLTRKTRGDSGFACSNENRDPKCNFNAMMVPDLEMIVTADSRTCTFVDDDGCRFTFVYGHRYETGELQV